MTTVDHTSPVTVDDQIDTIVARIAAGMYPIQSQLFVSRARGEAAPWSNVDLLDILREARDRRA